MSLLVLRLAGALQSWSGYRHMVSMATSAPTEIMPRKSAINGLIGAAIGPKDNGYGSARDLDAVGNLYTLHVRAESQNAIAEDFQVLHPLPAAAHRSADRANRIGSASTGAFPAKRGGGNFETTVGRRDFLAHSEFLAVLETSDNAARAWAAALQEPRFMPYLGRMSCPPSFPFMLGQTRMPLDDLLAQLPHVRKYKQLEPSPPPPLTLEAFTVSGDYDQHQYARHNQLYNPPSTTRADQLAWVKEHLTK